MSEITKLRHDIGRYIEISSELATDLEELIRASSAFIEELKAFGYGQTSEKALPGSYDAFVATLERVSRREPF